MGTTGHRSFAKPARGNARLVEALEPRALFAVGSVDPTFANNGQALQFPGGTALTAVRDTVPQADGKIVVVGRAPDAASGGSDLAVARLNADGTPDAAFGTGGVVVLPSPGDDDSAESVALQADGKIVVAGYLGTTGAGGVVSVRFAVARLTAAGALDTTFGGGVQTPNFAGTGAAPASEASAVVVLPDGNILAAGTTDVANTPTPAGTATALARFRPDGTLDPAFGQGGLVARQVSGSSQYVADVAVQADGKIVAVGAPHDPGVSSPTFLAERFNADGSTDDSFGTGGAAVATFPGAFNAAANTVVLQPDGKIVLGGYVVTAAPSGNAADVNYNFGLARFTATGAADKKFGTGGIVLGSPTHLTSGFQGYEVAQRILLEPDGGLIVSGLRGTTTANANQGQLSATVAGYEPNGVPDAEFGTNGQMVIGSFPVQPLGLSSPGGIVANAVGDLSEGFRDIQRKDAAIVAALGDRLVLVSSAGGQVSVTQLIGSGPDLTLGAPTGLKSRSVLGGAKAVIALPVTSDGNVAFEGVAPVTLVLSTDATVDGADRSVATTSPSLRLKSGGTKAVKIRFTFPTDLPDGQYFLLARIAPGASLETDASNNTAADPEPVTVARPVVDLGGSFATPAGAAGPLAAGGKAKIALVLENTGNVAAKGPVTFTVVASADAAPGAGDMALQVTKPVNVNLKAGGSKAVSLSVLVPAGLPVGSYFLIAVLDAAALADTNAVNDTIVASVPVVVS